MKSDIRVLKQGIDKSPLEKQLAAEGYLPSGTVVSSPAPLRSRVIKLKERNTIMMKNDLILRNPLKLLGRTAEDLLPEGGFGVVLARAGVGKTALLVQLALNAMLKNMDVLHISLTEPVQKVALWYTEMFRHLAEKHDDEPVKQIWETLLPHRFIMTFKVEGFSVPKLEERLTDLTEQNIFTPGVIFIDGLPFDDGAVRRACSDLKALARRHGVQVWFAAPTHRHEAPGPDGMPNQLKDVADLFEVIVQLQPDGKAIHVKPLKGGPEDAAPKPMVLDPSTMLLVENG